MLSIRQGRLVVGAVTLMLSGAYLWQSLQLDFGSLAEPGAALFPTLMAVVLMISAVVVLVEEFTSQRSEGWVEVPSGAGRRKLLGFLGSLAGYVLLLPLLGQLLASFAGTAAMVRLLGGRSLLASVLVGAVVAGASYYVFVEVLGVPMPEGLFDLGL